MPLMLMQFLQNTFYNDNDDGDENDELNIYCKEVHVAYKGKRVVL